MKNTWHLKQRRWIGRWNVLFLMLITLTTVYMTPAASTDDTWIRRASISTPRDGVAAAVVNNTMYILGGVDPWWTTIEEYDPSDDSWRRRAPMPTARGYFAAVEIGGKIYTFGGRDKTGSLAIVLVYNPVTDTWTQRANMPEPREHFAAVAVDGQIYLFGGENQKGYLDSVLQYDPVTDTWHNLNPIPTPRSRLAAAAVTGKIYVCGGTNEQGALAMVEVYDKATNTWNKTRAPLPTPRHSLAGVAVGGRLYAIGGWEWGATISTIGGTVEEYDVGSNTWRRRAELPIYQPKSLVAGVAVGGKIYALDNGGRLFEYDPPFFDTDGDGFADDEELGFGTNPFVEDVDNDNDGLPDSWEEPRAYDPDRSDTDGDGLDDGDEFLRYKTNPLESDVDLDKDGDGLSNVAEVDMYGTNLDVADTDGDGLNDGDEIHRYMTDPLVADAEADMDNDGLLNVNEVNNYGTDPLDPDTDDDDLTDGAEIEGNTDPHLPDTDGDGWKDADYPLPTFNNFYLILPGIGFVGALVSIRRVQHKRRLQRLVETPVLLLILTEGGTAVFSHKFELGEQLDEQLIGGLLSAINAFGQDAFAGSGTDQITYHEYSVMLNTEGELLFCYIYQGSSHFAREKLDLFVESVRTTADIWNDLDIAMKKRVFFKPSDENQLPKIIKNVFQI